MRLWNRFLMDQAGLVLSAEAVLLGTLGVIGVTVGLSAASTAVNEELTDLALAFRSLDQSYELEGRDGCGARTAGSTFRQEPVAESLERLCDQVREDKRRVQEHAEEVERRLRELHEQEHKEHQATERREAELRERDQLERQKAEQRAREEEQAARAKEEAARKKAEAKKKAEQKKREEERKKAAEETGNDPEPATSSARLLT
jgi:membrane protein involved in colicin uptake